MSTGGSPAGSAFTKVFGDFLFVANPASSALNVIDVETFDLVSSLPIAAPPQDIVIYGTSEDSEAFFSQSDGTVIAFEVETGIITATITVGSDPGELTNLPDESEVYVTNGEDGTVSVINTTSLTVTHTITLGSKAISIAATPDSSTIYVGTESAGVAIIDTTTKAVTGTIANPGANNGVSFTPNGPFLAVGSETIESPFSEAGLGIVRFPSTTTESAVPFSGPLSVVTFDFPFVNLALQGDSGIEKTLTQESFFNRLRWVTPEIEFNEIIIRKSGIIIARLPRQARSFIDGNLNKGVTNTYTDELVMDGVVVSDAEVTLTTAS